MLPIALRPEASAEFIEAFDWYDARRQGLGVAFASRVQETLDRIAERPEAKSVVIEDIRRAVIR